MDMLRQLTRKFRAQDLNDNDSESPSSTTALLHMKEDALDSGTASDEEIVRILPRSKEVEGSFPNRDKLHDEGPNGQDSSLVRTNWMGEVSTSVDCSPVSMSKSLSVSSSLLSRYNEHCTDCYPHGAALVACNGRHSVASSDYERCSLDFEASSLSELESHSSEEELASINRDEKRKWSQMNGDGSLFSDDDSEVHEVFRSRQNDLSSFCSLSVCLTKPLGPSPASESVSASGRGTSPRKRHRRDCFGLSALHRPSLDFYKMQKTCIVRRHHTLNRPRMVKLWIVNGSQRPTKTTFDPSPFCFRSLSWTPTNTEMESSHQMV